MRVQYKPFVRWLWLGALLMAFGGVLAVLDKRYRRAAVNREVPKWPAEAILPRRPPYEASATAITAADRF